MAPAVTDLVIESSPNVAEIFFCSTTFMGTGKAPALSMIDSSEALSGVKLPEITARPSIIGSLTIGEVTSRLSKKMATGLLMFFEVISANSFLPSSVNSRAITGSLVAPCC